jgi:hypothetical protein
MNRRSLFAFAALALAEIRAPVAQAADPKCIHDHQCGDGRVCIDGQCRDRDVVPCTVDADCTSPAVCRESICVTITVTSGGVTLVQPVTLNVFRRPRRRKGHRRHR